VSVPAILFLVFAGPGLLSLGIWTLCKRTWYDGIPAAELLIDRATGLEPAPRTGNDRRFARVEAWLNIGFGIFFTFCLAAVIISLLWE